MTRRSAAATPAALAPAVVALAAALLAAGCSADVEAPPDPQASSTAPEPTGPVGSLVQPGSAVDLESVIGALPLAGPLGTAAAVVDDDTSADPSSQVLRSGGSATLLATVADQGRVQAAASAPDGTAVMLPLYGRSVLRLAPSDVVDVLPLSGPSWRDDDTVDPLADVIAFSPDASRAVLLEPEVVVDPLSSPPTSAATGALRVAAVDTTSGALSAAVTPALGRAGAPTSGASVLEAPEETALPVAASVAADGSVLVVVDTAAAGDSHQDVLVRLGADLQPTGSPVLLPTGTAEGDHPSVRALPDGSAVVVRQDRAPGGAVRLVVLRVTASGEVSEVADLGAPSGETWTSVQPDGAFAYAFGPGGTTVVDLATGAPSTGPRPCEEGGVTRAPTFDADGAWQAVTASCFVDGQVQARVVVLGAAGGG